MDWIFDNLQIVFLIVLGLGSLLKTMWEAKAKRQAEREWDPEDHVPLEDDQSYRKPQPVTPPPLPRQPPPPEVQSSAGRSHEGATKSRRRLEQAAAIEADETARILKHQQDLAENLRQIRETRASTTGGASETRARIAAKGSPKAIAAVPKGFSARLRNPAELRRAFVMREILDRPVGLR